MEKNNSTSSTPSQLCLLISYIAIYINTIVLLIYCQYGSQFFLFAWCVLPQLWTSVHFSFINKPILSARIHLLLHVQLCTLLLHTSKTYLFHILLYHEVFQCTINPILSFPPQHQLINFSYHSHRNFSALSLALRIPVIFCATLALCLLFISFAQSLYALNVLV